MFKKIVLGALSAAALLFIVSLFLPSTYRVERSIIIQTSAASAYQRISDLKEWSAWSPWATPDVKSVVSTASTGVGAWQSWQSESQGNGKMLFTAAVPNQSVSYDLWFEGYDGVVRSDMILSDAQGGVKLTWLMHGDSGFNPVDKYFNLLMDSLVGADFEKGLKNLKAICEKKS